jgi:phage tail sheath protein FI
MPVQVTYPGVYIEEISSGAHSITGVTTATCAFLGRALMGPTDLPQTIFSFGDYQRIYGGLTADMPMSYAVRDFFLNGGGEAVIVRLVNKTAPVAHTDPPAATPATFTDSTTGLTFTASSEGSWSNATAMPVVTRAGGKTPPPSAPFGLGVLLSPVDPAIESMLGLAPGASNLMRNVTVSYQPKDGSAPMYEQFLNVRINSDDTSASRIDKLLLSQSNLLRAVKPSMAAGTFLSAAATLADSQAATADATKQTADAKETADASAGADVKAADAAAAAVADKAAAVADAAKAAADGAAPAAVKAGTPTVPLENPAGKTAAPVATGGNNPVVAPSGGSTNPPVTTTTPATAPAIPQWLLLAGGVDSPKLAPTDYFGDLDSRTGMYMLEHVDLFNILCIPPDSVYVENGSIDTDTGVYSEAAEYCQSRRAMLIVDPPSAWTNAAKTGDFASIATTDLTINGLVTRNAAVYFPRIQQEDPLMKSQLGTFVPCGMVAGVWAQTDLTRGVWKAPAGLDAGLNGVSQLEFNLTDQQNGLLNPKGINCLRNFVNVGPVVWGARTMRGADMLEDDYKYVPVRRLTLFIEESLYRGTQWAVVEPNDENLWSSLRLSIDTFMANLNRQGAFYQYKITCDATTTSSDDIAQGIVRVVVAFAPVKPAEFVVLEITQQASQTPA